MQFTTLVNAVLVLALAHVGAVMGSPTSLQNRAECSLVCVNDAQCVDCLGVTAALDWTCNVLGVPGAEGVRFFSRAILVYACVADRSWS